MKWQTFLFKTRRSHRRDAVDFFCCANCNCTCIWFLFQYFLIHFSWTFICHGDWTKRQLYRLTIKTRHNIMRWILTRVSNNQMSEEGIKFVFSNECLVTNAIDIESKLWTLNASNLKHCLQFIFSFLPFYSFSGIFLFSILTSLLSTYTHLINS